MERDIERAINDIKLLESYIDGARFEAKPSISTVDNFEEKDMSQNYPISEGYVYRIKKEK